MNGKINHRNVAREIRQLAVWIIMTYGEMKGNGRYDIRFAKRNYVDTLISYINAYKECNGEYKYGDPMERSKNASIGQQISDA